MGFSVGRPSCTSGAANSIAVPLRWYSNSRRTGLPRAVVPAALDASAGMAGFVGLILDLAWIPVFSSDVKSPVM